MSSTKSEISKVSIEPTTSKAAESFESISSSRLRSLLEEDTNCSLKKDADKSIIRDISINKLIKQKTKHFLKLVDHLVKLMINMHIGPAALDQERYRDIISELLRMQKTIDSGEADSERLDSFNKRLQTADENIQHIHMKWTQHYVATLNDVTQQCQELIQLFDELKKHNKKHSSLQNDVTEFLNYTLAKKKSLYKLGEIEHITSSQSINTNDQVLERIKLLKKRLKTPFAVNFGNVPKLFGDSAKKEMKRKGKQKKGSLKSNVETKVIKTEGVEFNVLQGVDQTYVDSSQKINGQPEGENPVKITLKDIISKVDKTKSSDSEVTKQHIEQSSPSIGSEELSKCSFPKSLLRVFSKNTSTIHANIENNAQINIINMIDIKKQLIIKLRSNVQTLINKAPFNINNLDTLIFVMIMVLACVL